MFLTVKNTEQAKQLLPIYMLTVGADFPQPPVRRPNGAPLHQIFFVDRGHVAFHCAGEDVVLGEGGVVFMKKGHPMAYERLSEEARTGWVSFDGEGVEGLLSYFQACPFSYQSNAALREQHRACVRAVERNASPEALSGLAYDLALSYFRSLNEEVQSNELAAAKAYIEQRFAADLSVGEVAAAVGISESLLYRLFRREGTTPVVYLRGVRLQNAKRMLLENAKMPVAEIARLCGFADTAYFCKVFRDAERVTPKKYRAAYLS